MKGSVIPRGKYRRIQFEGPRGPNGERKQVMETIRGPKREAQRALRERIAAVEGGAYVPKRREIVAQFLES